MFTSLLTPWQVLPSGYIYLFFVVTLLVGLAVVFSNFKSFYLLLLLILYSFLLHSYLPLSHPLIYGADGWRHIASETQILQGHWPVHPTLADGTQAGFGVGDLSYGLFWLVSAELAKLLGISLIVITKWFQPILFSIAFPLLLWKLTEYLGLSTRVRLFTIWFSNLPFALQAAGSFSLPVNLGFLFFLGGLTILAARLGGRFWATNKLLIFYGVILAFNYSLYLLLYLLAWTLLALLRLAAAHPARRRLIVIGGGLMAMITVPVIELFFGYSAIQPVSFFFAFKQFVGNLLGWYVAAGPRWHDIATGNILFNQPPLSAWVPNFLTRWRWWLPIFALGFWVSLDYISLVTLRQWLARAGGNLAAAVARAWIVILTIGLFGSYFISRYLLAGEQALARRLEATLALLAILCFGFFKAKLISILPAARHPALWVTTVAIGAIAITASYSLGPDARAVSRDEYRAMEYVWSQEKSASKHCVIADTYPLLALEAISGKEIIGGGFPIDANFGQSERVALYNKYSSELEIKDNTAVQLPVPGHETCWFYR